VNTSKTIGYIRVSTDFQADKGLGLDVQEEAIRAWCRQHDREVVAIYRDEGLSGALDASARPGLAAALEAIKAGEANALVVHKLDRLARSLTVQEAALAHVWRDGGDVFAVDTGPVIRDDPDDPVRTAMRQMIGVFSQLERGMIAARMRAGRRLKAKRGGYAGGRPPYGFRAEAHELVEVADEQDAIKLAQKLRDNGISYKRIATELERLGFRRKSGSTRWHAAQVSRALDRLADDRLGKVIAVNPVTTEAARPI
jgi:DNA invertase Pin-like site-specific DNA recombinase